MIVESAQVRADRPESEQRERIATISQDPAQVVESGQQPAGHVAGHERLLGFGLPVCELQRRAK